MQLTKDIELLEGLPVAYIRSLDALAVADLHLGYEVVMAKKGMLLPKVNFKKIMETIKEAAEKTKAKSIIVDGDIKNEFSEVDQEEFNELFDFVKSVREMKLEPVLIKGNHDNFVERYREPFNLKIYAQEARIGDYLFFHGEELPCEIKGVKMLIMGHEHPAIGIINAAGRKEKVSCFLSGTYKRIPLLVLPAMNFYAAGVDINFQSRASLLSPVFGTANVDHMRAIAVGFGSTMDFGEIGKLRNQ